jgi:hypothetical protein
MENSSLKKCNVPFGIVPNELLNNDAISMKAKGLFAFMQSKPEDWYFTVKMISLQTKDGIDSISEGLKELELFGYLERKKAQTGNGFTTTYFLYFESLIVNKSNLGKSNLGKSLNNSNKDISKKEESKKEEREGSLAFFEVNFPSDYERLMMHYKSKINDFVKFSELFEATVLQEGLEFKRNVIEGRFVKYARNWISNQGKYDVQVIELNANVRKEKISGI